MKSMHVKLICESTSQIDFINITQQVQEYIDKVGLRSGQINLHPLDTTVGILLHHDEALLKQDFIETFEQIAPVEKQYAHDMFELKRANAAQGRTNAHAHCKAMLTGSSLTLNISDGELCLGKEQDILIIDFDGGRKREVSVNMIGE